MCKNLNLLDIFVGNRKKVITGILILLAVITAACNYISPENPNVHIVTDQFIEAVENNQLPVAFTLLSQNAQMKIEHEHFLKINGDFQEVVELFRQSEIETRSKNEIPLYVSKFGGQKGSLLFIVIEENKIWKIENIIENPL